MRRLLRDPPSNTASIGTVSSDEKAALAKAHGCDHTIIYTRENFTERVKQITSGRGVRVVYDSIGKDTFMGSLECLQPLGMMALFGAASGPVPPFDPASLNPKGSLFLTRPSLAHYLATREELLWRAGEVLDLVAKGSLTVRIDAVYPLANAADAHRALEGRKTTGKLLIST